MNSELFVLDCPPSPEVEYEYVNAPTSLKMAAKRYTKDASELQTQGLTLLFAHCIGAHKEQWEPVIDKLFDFQHSMTASYRIREAWSFDWQSHGDSAVLNREQLKAARPYAVSAYEWAAAISAFVESPRMKGHRIVTLGHSGGVGALVHSARYLRQLRPYHAMIIIEPAFLPRDLFHLYQHQNLAAVNFVYSTTLSRRESWASREEAFDYLRQRAPCSLWDERVLRLFVEHALEDSDNQDGRSVVLKCGKQVEAITYCDLEPALEAAVYLKSLCSRFPIHLIWGSIDDFVPGFAKEILSDPAQGWTFSSISKIDGSGHMVVQENPDRLALTIAGILDIPCLQYKTAKVISRL